MSRRAPRRERSDLAHAFRTDELDPKLLAAPFVSSTNWYVIAGAPSCGKTTIVEMLATCGYPIVPEPARTYIEGEMAAGRTIDDLHRDAPGLQRTVVTLEWAVESGLPPDEFLILDGALPMSLAWYRAFGLDPNEILPQCFAHRYAGVFLLDPLPLDVDAIRFADQELVTFLHHWIARDFHSLGYDAIRVPAVRPEQRLRFVIDRLPAQFSRK
jgi:predicted ATPase